MHTNTVFRIVIFLSAITLFALLGCGGKPIDYHPISDIPEGPGIFSKEDGVFTLNDSKSDKGGQKPKPASEVGSQTAARSGVEKTGAAAAGAQMSDSEEYRKFQQFRQWQNEKKEFEEFQQWKKSKQGSDEYQEFLEWQKWKEFQNWREGQQKE